MSNGKFFVSFLGCVYVAGSLLSTPVLADYNESDDRPPRHSGSAQDSDPHTDWARVVRVEPLHRVVQVSTPRQECWEEPVKRYRTHGYGHRSYAPVIIAGILGGVVGNQFGKGAGNTLMTAAGVILGGAMANDAQAHHRRDHHAARESYTTYEERCETTNSYHSESRLDGYLVDYEYNGRIYSTRTRTHPGERIRVAVTVTPQD